VSPKLDWIRAAFCNRTYLVTTTGLPKMLKKDISQKDLETAICDDAPEVIEDYPDDWRGPACLVLGWLEPTRPLHVVVGYGDSEDVAIDVITAYHPEAPDWYNPRVRSRR
jgi:hypothetical protein